MNELISMSPHELSRTEVMRQLKAKQITQAQPAAHLNLTVRHASRSACGAPIALVSKRRGQPSNNHLAAEVKDQARQLIGKHYSDFGPTLAHEKLTEVHHLTLSVETVRKLLVTDGHWEAQRPNQPEIHQLRQRRPRRGELVQLDGSPFAWFENRAPAGNLLVYIDDATGQLGELFFTPTETTFSYFTATRRYLARHGRPIAFYSDKHSIFRLTNAGATSGTGQTQFGRAMTELDIEIICANSPQAKGRVERVNQTLQDRLVKELRLQGIADPAQANAYMPAFMADFNRRFGVPPANPAEAHRPLTGPRYRTGVAGHNLDRIFTVQTPRSVSKNLTVQHHKQVYQLQVPRSTHAFRGAQVLVLEDADEHLTIEYQGRQLAHTRYQEQSHQAAVVPSKLIAPAVDAAQQKQAPTKPAADPPWRHAPSLQSKKRPAGRASPGGHLYFGLTATHLGIPIAILLAYTYV